MSDEITPYCLIIHLFFSIWMFGNFNIIPEEKTDQSMYNINIRKLMENNQTSLYSYDKSLEWYSFWERAYGKNVHIIMILCLAVIILLCLR